MRAFCREQNINEHSFYMWRRRLKHEAPLTIALVERERSAEPAMVELVLTTGDRLRIPAEASTLRTVLNAPQPLA